MDNEPYGQGNEYDYGMRIYNPRIGRFLSVDPASKSFPWYSAYQFAGNKPVWCVDLDGQEETLITAVKAIWGDIENWWNAPTGAGQKITGQGAAIELGYPDYVPQTNGDWMWTISGQSLKAYNEYGSFQMYSEVEGVNSNIYSGSKVNTNIAPQQPSTTEEAPTGSTQIKIQNSSNVTSNSQTVEANDGNPNGIENNTVATNTQSQKKLQVGSYGNMKKANVKTGLSADHIPSFASLRSNLEQQLGRTLTATEATQLKNTSLTLVYETTIHQEFSRTYGGRNNPLKIGIDMQDLVGAVENDINALRPALLKAGYSAQDINAATEQLKSKYKLK